MLQNAPVLLHMTVAGGGRHGGSAAFRSIRARLAVPSVEWSTDSHGKWRVFVALPSVNIVPCVEKITKDQVHLPAHFISPLTNIMPAPLFRVLMGSIEKRSFPLLRGMRNRQVNKKRKSPNENSTVTIIISSLELYWLPCLPRGLTWPFNSLLMEGFAKFKFSHTMSPWTLRVSCVQCWVFPLSPTRKQFSDGDESHFFWGSQFPWFWNEFWPDNLPIIWSSF